MAVSREDVSVPGLPEEEVPFPPFNGDVLVRGLLMSRRLANDRLHVAALRPLEGESEEQAHARAGSQIVTRMLHHSVVDAGGTPLCSEEEWDRLGALHRIDVFRVFNVAMRLSGHDLELATKN
ncbi:MULTISPECIES: hypothetical protein [unclassified Variovorax]|uniref:hypothetical protein n=1 Tax=unclassified Variovorax TaxID=663243 RepID=UPI002577399A|nr:MULTISPECIES: hypothetical protein [unclassified Variovorax]MDM0086751.1 hypothetical protein [Variovorax sp. J22G40]MDM0144993.1 hypothetical protein [Variovorax sp. J2P1-31]